MDVVRSSLQANWISFFDMALAAILNPMGISPTVTSRTLISKSFWNLPLQFKSRKVSRLISRLGQTSSLCTLAISLLTLFPASDHPYPSLRLPTFDNGQGLHLFQVYPRKPNFGRKLAHKSISDFLTAPQEASTLAWAKCPFRQVSAPFDKATFAPYL